MYNDSWIINIKKGVAFYSHTPFLYQLSKTLKTCCYCASFICRNNSFCFSFKPVGNFTL